MKIKQRLILVAYFLLVPVFLWAGPMITGQGGGGGSMTYPGVGVAKSTGAAWDTSVAVGTDLQAWDTILDSIAATTPVNQGILSYLTVGGYDWRTTHQHDDSAAQFKSATASKGTLKFDQTGITDAKVVTVKYTSADNYTVTPTITGNSAFTYPTSGTLIGHDGTDANLAAINLITTGTISGGIPIYTLNSSTNIPTASQLGAMFYITAASTQSLSAIAPGANLCFFVASSVQARIDPNNSDAIWLAGVASAAGAYIQSSTLGDSVCLIYKSANNWWAHKNGTWTSQ